MRVTGVSVVVVEVPQIPPIAPYRSHVRSSSTTQSGIVRIDTDAGLTGWGEFNVNFLPNLSGRRMTNRAQWLVGATRKISRRFIATVRWRRGSNRALNSRCGTFAARRSGCRSPRCWRGDSPRIALAACMGIQTYERAGEIAAYYVEQGYGTLKTRPAPT